MSRRVFNVAELIGAVNEILRQGFSSIWVEGEVTNAKPSPRGHLYFTLKDETAAIDCVMWASRARRLKFDVEDGLAALVLGSLTVYPQRGRFQMVVDELEPQGTGALQLAFEQLKQRLAREGLFAEERKRPLPALPQRVGLVTSSGGAALRDMLKILRRFRHLRVILAPSAVQGEGAAAEIASAIRRLGASGLVDVLIVGRGGGSLEDLWAFNEEAVARAIAQCPVPVISGVGHQVDFTIADFVADLRAATPTHAAEIVVTHLAEQQRRLDEATGALIRDVRRHLEAGARRLDAVEGSAGLARLPQRLRHLAARLDVFHRLAPAMRHALANRRARLEASARMAPRLKTLMAERRRRLERNEGFLRSLPRRLAASGHIRLVESRSHQLGRAMRGLLEALEARVAAAEKGLVHLSPGAVLDRGYSITTVEGESTPLRDPARIRPGTRLTTALARGMLRSVVTGNAGRRRRRKESAVREQPGLFETPEEGS